MIAHAHIRLTEATVRIRRVTVEVPFALDQRSGAGSGLGINRERRLALEKDIALNAETEGKLDRFQFLQRRSEEHTSELQSLMRISYAVFCLTKKKTETTEQT